MSEADIRTICERLASIEERLVGIERRLDALPCREGYERWLKVHDEVAAVTSALTEHRRIVAGLMTIGGLIITAVEFAARFVGK